ncbi:site-specific integrase [Paenibacillus sp. ov031]|uniref:site-specific integrase n=1 Tax=Paenibacillus sp. ov031 TaxID=1761879 RepID=UPI00147A7BC4|nr:site-specific integrase [Paenibacillus sp. ov031]
MQKNKEWRINLLIRRRLGDLNETNTLNAIENVFFQNMSKHNFEEHYDHLKEHKLIRAESFEDTVWLLPDSHKDRDVIFHFNLEVFKELNLAIKGYVLLKRVSGRAVSSCHNMLQTLKYSALASNGFKHIANLETYLLQQTPLVAYENAWIIKNFFLFYNHDKASEINNVCNSIPKPTRRNRDLPNYKDILTFDEHIIDFFSYISYGDEHVRFFPVYIWWKLTNVIPMRVIEFLTLRKNCIEQKDNETYWINIPREKKQADSPFKVDVTDTLEINHEMYSIINKYICTLENLNIHSEYLIPFDAYVRYLIRPYQTIQQRKGKQNRLIDKYLQRLIDDFYKEIIQDESVDKITCGDTRHFAIMNMFLQGFNMLSIARMAGHDTLGVQQNYYSHIDHYLQSQVYLMAQEKSKVTFKKNIGAPLLGKTRELIDRGKIYEYEDLLNFHSTTYGFCSYQEADFPDGCAEDCRVCPKYIFKPPVNEIEMGIRWLKDYSDLLTQKVRETTEFMLTISKHMYYDLKNLSHQKTGQDQLNAASQRLVQMMDHLSVVNSTLLENHYEKQ